MNIYTSYFSNAKKLTKAGVMIIGIAQFPPKWFTGVSLKKLAPTASILYEKSDEVYEQRFRSEIIGQLDAKAVLEEIQQISGGKDVALCCFEKNVNDCHRKIVGEWLTLNTGVTVEEYKEKPKFIQLSLFSWF